MGSPDFAVPSLRRLVEDGYDVVGVYTQPDREAGRGRVVTPPPVKQYALEQGLAVFQPPSLRRTEALEGLRALAPEIIIVAAFGQILRRPVLELPAHGVLNVHASLLPRWRGAAPVVAAILAGDEETGVSIMQVDEGLDTGPVVSRRAVPITRIDTGGGLTDRLARLGADLLSDTLPAWLDGEIVPEAQDNARATYAPRIEKDAGHIDWSLPAVEIWRRVRAFNPWPGAFTFLHGHQIRIHDAWPLPEGPPAQPGMVVLLTDEMVHAVPAELPRAAFAIGAGAGLLVPLKLQRAGKRALFAQEFARGEHDLIGATLG
jgi:methionyl-tRNA formyltransferase